MRHGGWALEWAGVMHGVTWCGSRTSQHGDVGWVPNLGHKLGVGKTRRVPVPVEACRHGLVQLLRTGQWAVPDPGLDSRDCALGEPLPAALQVSISCRMSWWTTACATSLK